MVFIYLVPFVNDALFLACVCVCVCVHVKVSVGMTI